MRYFLAMLVVSIIAVMGLLGFRGQHSRKPSLYIFPDMEWQAKLRPQKPNDFFANGISSQLPVPAPRTSSRNASSKFLAQAIGWATSSSTTLTGGRSPGGKRLTGGLRNRYRIARTTGKNQNSR